MVRIKERNWRMWFLSHQLLGICPNCLITSKHGMGGCRGRGGPSRRAAWGWLPAEVKGPHSPGASLPSTHRGAARSLATPAFTPECVLPHKVPGVPEDTEYKLDRNEFWIHSLPSILLPQPAAPSPCLLGFSADASSPPTQGGQAVPDCSLMPGHWENQVNMVSNALGERRLFEDTQREAWDQSSRLGENCHLLATPGASTAERDSAHPPFWGHDESLKIWYLTSCSLG